jgi:hypothetical protein
MTDFADDFDPESTEDRAIGREAARDRSGFFSLMRLNGAEPHPFTGGSEQAECLEA